MNPPVLPVSKVGLLMAQVKECTALGRTADFRPPFIYYFLVLRNLIKKRIVSYRIIIYFKTSFSVRLLFSSWQKLQQWNIPFWQQRSLLAEKGDTLSKHCVLTDEQYRQVFGKTLLTNGHMRNGLKILEGINVPYPCCTHSRFNKWI